MKNQSFVISIIKTSIFLAMAWIILDAVSPWTAWSPAREPQYYGWNLFSYFTIESNLIMVVVLLLAVVATWTGKPLGRWYTYLRTATLVYMIITAIVYQVLLADPTLPFDWHNFAMHRLAPLFMVVWWLIWPGQRPISASQANMLLIFPLIWILYTLIRAAILDWYPYPFLDPNQAGGLVGVLSYVLAISTGFIIVSQIVAWVSRRLVSIKSLY